MDKNIGVMLDGRYEIKKRKALTRILDKLRSIIRIILR